MNYIELIKFRLRDKIHVNNILLDLYLLVLLTKGTNTTLQDVHDAWAIWKNSSFREHWSIKPFNELKPEVQSKDAEYVEAIIEIAKEFNVDEYITTGLMKHV